MGTAVVVGAGIGGLAGALALTRAGWSVTVLERAASPGAAGAALVLWPNALRALRVLGAAGSVLAVATPHRVALGRRPDGRVLTRVDLSGLADRVGEPAVTVLRTDLHEILRAALTRVPVHTGTTVTDVGTDSDGRPTVRAGERVWRADLVVAADGLGSVVRDRLGAGGRVVAADYVAWRAVVGPRRAPRLDAGGETLGVGRRFGCASLGERGVYWYATLPGPLDEAPPASQLDRLRTALRDWHPPIPALLAATDPADLLHHQVTELRPLPRRFTHRLGTGGVVLVGDAAHAMTPNLGQGACLALEDAVTLGTLLPADGDLTAGLELYQRLRYRRAVRLTRQSRQMGLALELRRPATVWLRDAAMAVLPDALATRAALAPTYWRPTRRAAPHG